MFVPYRMMWSPMTSRNDRKLHQFLRQLNFLAGLSPHRGKPVSGYSLYRVVNILKIVNFVRSWIQILVSMVINSVTQCTKRSLFFISSDAWESCFSEVILCQKYSDDMCLYFQGSFFYYKYLIHMLFLREPVHVYRAVSFIEPHCVQ